jgi:hypothetical protein
MPLSANFGDNRRGRSGRALRGLQLGGVRVEGFTLPLLAKWAPHYSLQEESTGGNQHFKAIIGQPTLAS